MGAFCLMEREGNMATVMIGNEKKEFETGIPYEEIAKQYQAAYDDMIAQPFCAPEIRIF